MKKNKLILSISLLFILTNTGEMFAQADKKLVHVSTSDGKTISGFIQKPITDTIITVTRVDVWDDTLANTQLPVSTINRIEIPGKRTSFFERTLIGLGGGTVLGTIIGLTYTDENASWFDVTLHERLQSVAWGAGIGAVLGLISGIASKEATKTFYFANRSKLSAKQKRKLDAVSF